MSPRTDTSPSAGGPAGRGGPAGAPALDTVSTGGTRVVHRRPVDWAPVPRVNLLPPEIVDARHFRRVQRALAGIVLLVGAVSGMAVLWADADIDSAQADLTRTKVEGAALQREQARYAEVPQVTAALDAARSARTRALATDVLWYRFLSDLAVNTPPSTTLSSVTVTMGGAAVATDPLVPTGLGQVKVTGQADKFTDVAAWLDAVSKVNGLTGTRLSSAARDDGGQPTSSGVSNRVSYSGTAVVSSAALSHRFDQKAS